MTFKFDGNGNPILCFTPTKAMTILNGDFTPEKTILCKLGSSVDITIDNKVVTYDTGIEICLDKGTTYNFNADVDVHYMA